VLVQSPRPITELAHCIETEPRDTFSRPQPSIMEKSRPNSIQLKRTFFSRELPIFYANVGTIGIRVRCSAVGNLLVLGVPLL